LLTNFNALKANDDESFVFPTQVQHVFYFEKLKQPWWKVVLHKEPRSKHVVIKAKEEQLMIQDNVISIEVRLEILDVACHMAMVGAIELCGTKAIMAFVELQMLGEDDYA